MREGGRKVGIDSQSPFHQQACVTGATILGGAVDALGGAGVLSTPGFIYGAAVGFVIGQVICTWKPIDRAFKDKLDFESGLKDFSASSVAIDEALDKLAALPTVKSREEAAVVLRFTLNVASADPAAFWRTANDLRGARLDGEALHGLASLSNSVAQILAHQKA